MDILEILKNEYLSIVFGGLAGILTAWITQRVLNKRGLFSYFVNHNRVGIFTEDTIFGNVSVTWNSNPIKHLFFSTIELKNESLNDYENVIIRTYTNNTTLLSESLLNWWSRLPGNQPVSIRWDVTPNQIQMDEISKKKGGDK